MVGALVIIYILAQKCSLSELCRLYKQAIHAFVDVKGQLAMLDKFKGRESTLQSVAGSVPAWAKF